MSDNSYIKNRLELLSDAEYANLINILLPRLGSYSCSSLIRYLNYLEDHRTDFSVRLYILMTEYIIDSPAILQANRKNYNRYAGDGRWIISDGWRETEGAIER